MSRFIAVDYGLAFSHKAGIDGKPVTGNPAAVVICEGKLPTPNQMADLAQVAHVGAVVFLCQRQNNEFDVRYYFPDGTPCYLSGHGTLVAAYYLNQLYGFRHAILHHQNGLTFNCDIDRKMFVSVELPAYSPKPMSADQAATYRKMLGLATSELSHELYCPELQDFVMVLDDSRQLRQLNPDYDQLTQQITDHGARALILTAKSKNDILDFETRIFCPGVGTEDSSCGSANCYLVPFWKKILHPAGQEEELVNFCPLTPGSESFGGIEYGNFDALKNTITISGFIDSLPGLPLPATKKWQKSG